MHLSLTHSLSFSLFDKVVIFLGQIAWLDWSSGQCGRLWWPPKLGRSLHVRINMVHITGGIFIHFEIRWLNLQKNIPQECLWERTEFDFPLSLSLLTFFWLDYQ